MEEVPSPDHVQSQGSSEWTSEAMNESFKRALIFSGKFGAAATTTTGVCFILNSETRSRFFSRPQILLPVAMASTLIGFVYNWSKFHIRKIDPETNHCTIIEESMQSSVYWNPTTKSEYAYRSIVNDILVKEFNRNLKEKDTIPPTEIEDIVINYRKEHPGWHQGLSYRGEVLAACIPAWAMTPIMKSFLLSTALGVTIGSAFYYGRKIAHNFWDKKLWTWMFEKRVDFLREKGAITKEMSDNLMAIQQKSIPGMNWVKFQDRFTTLFSYFTILFPVVRSITQEEIDQKKYLAQLEGEYTVWRMKNRMPPVEKFYT